jgi:hypothetical protein
MYVRESRRIIKIIKLKIEIVKKQKLARKALLRRNLIIRKKS